MSGALIVGLTGQTGAGKSTVGEVFRNEGFAVIDCDRVAREVTYPGSKCLDELVELFGKEIRNPDNSLNRKALGRIVFSDREKLDRLNAAIFPYITAQIEREIAAFKQKGAMVILLDAPTLFESGADQMCEKIVSVTASAVIRLERICKRDDLSEEEGKKRMDSQLDEAYFRAHSDIIIENNGSREELISGALQAACRLKEYAYGH